MYQRALHNILLLRTVAPPAEQVTGLPTQQSAIPPTPSPTDPAPAPSQTTPEAQPTEPPQTEPARLDTPSSSVVCQPVSSRPEQPTALPAPPSPTPTQPRTPALPNEPNPISEHVNVGHPEGDNPIPQAEARPRSPARALPARHSPCHPRGASCPAAKPHPAELRRLRRSVPPAFQPLRHTAPPRRNGILLSCASLDQE
jgi:hypothetical protein